MRGWGLGVVFAISDGLVWAELGAAMPEAGGAYQYLKQSFGAASLGRLMSFLFVWQLLFSAPLSIASGFFRIAPFSGFLLPPLDPPFAGHTLSPALPPPRKFLTRPLLP